MKFKNSPKFDARRLLFLIVFSVLVSCNSASRLNEKGFKQLYKGNYIKAEELFNKALKKDDLECYGDSYHGLGLSAFEQGKYYQAVDRFNKAIELGNAESRRCRANCYYIFSKKDFTQGDYKSALVNIQVAIEDIGSEKPIDYIHYRAMIYGKIAKSSFGNGDFNEAWKYVNLAYNEGNNITRKSSLKLRAEVNFAFAINVKDKNSQISYCKAALRDDGTNDKIISSVYNLYMSLVAECIDEGDLYKAKDIFGMACRLNDVHLDIYDLFERNLHRGKGDLLLDVAKAKIYEINLRYTDAINLLKKHENKNNYLYAKEKLNYDLARYYAMSNDVYSSVKILRKFYTDLDMQNSYSYYREKAKSEYSFILISTNHSFINWLNGVNRIKISLNNVINIPEWDHGELKFGKYCKTDPYFVITHKGELILTTIKKENRDDIVWDQDEYYAVFDYDFDEPLNIKLVDSDISGDEIVENKNYFNLYLGDVSLVLNQIKNTRLNIRTEDFFNYPRIYSTYTKLPPKSSWLAFNEDVSIRYEHTEILQTKFMSGFYEKENDAYKSYYFISNMTSALTPCFVKFLISNTKNIGFITKQIFYYMLDKPNDVDDYKSFAFESFLEFVVSKIGNRYLKSANDVRAFCLCMYNKM